jgi:hypothetical protein
MCDDCNLQPVDIEAENADQRPVNQCDRVTGECRFGCDSCDSDALALWLPLSIMVFLPLTICIIYFIVLIVNRCEEDASKRRAKELEEIKDISRKDASSAEKGEEKKHEQKQEESGLQ